MVTESRYFPFLLPSPLLRTPIPSSPSSMSRHLSRDDHRMDTSSNSRQSVPLLFFAHRCLRLGPPNASRRTIESTVHDTLLMPQDHLHLPPRNAYVVVYVSDNRTQPSQRAPRRGTVAVRAIFASHVTCLMPRAQRTGPPHYVRHRPIYHVAPQHRHPAELPASVNPIRPRPQDFNTS